MISIVGSKYLQDKVGGVGVPRGEEASRGMAKNTDSRVSKEVQISLFSRQLADIAQQSSEREASLSREQLGKKGIDITQHLYGSLQIFAESEKKLFDADIPVSGDPEAVARARHAASYLKGEAGNPFLGMSREQLGLVIYDESGEFTLGERVAALKEADRQEFEWRKKICEKLMDDYNRMAKFSKESYAELIAHEQSLPAIEQAMSSEGYVAELWTKMSMAPSSKESEDGMFLDFWTRLKKAGGELSEDAFTSPELAKVLVDN